MDSPKVSIIVPVYNVEKYLKKCLTSLINQTLKDIEIICINDGSKDNSLKILNDFAEKDERIIVLNQTNQGQSKARNYGIRIAKGEYLGFVDSDDWLDLNYFEKLYNAAKENDCDIACAGFKRCGKIFHKVRKSYKKVQVYTDINDKANVDKVPKHNYVWNKIYRRSNWNFTFPEGRYFEDMALLIKILYSLGSMVVVPGTYYNYRKNPNSTINQNSTKHKDDNKWAKKELYAFAEEKDIKLYDYKKFDKKETIKLFGLTILKIYHYDNAIKYRLLGFIPVLSINT